MKAKKGMPAASICSGGNNSTANETVKSRGHVFSLDDKLSSRPTIIRKNKQATTETIKVREASSSPPLRRYNEETSAGDELIETMACLEYANKVQESMQSLKETCE